MFFGLAMPLPAMAAPPNYVCRGFEGPQADFSGTPMMTAKDGVVWIVKQNENRLIRVDKNHRVKAVIPGDGGTTGLEGLALGPDGAIWYSKELVHRMGRLPANGGKGIEYQLPDPNAFPGALAAAPNGRIWYVDGAGNKVGYMTSDGTVVAYDAPNTNNTNTAPNSITLAADNSVWVTSIGLNAVLRVDPESGAFTRYDIATPDAQPTLITRGPQGALWFLMPGVNKIGRITTSGQITEFAAGFEALDSLAAGPDGAVWYSSMGEVGRLDPSSGRVQKFACAGGGGMTVGPDGHLWIQSKTGSEIYVVKPRSEGSAARVVGAAD